MRRERERWMEGLGVGCILQLLRPGVSSKLYGYKGRLRRRQIMGSSLGGHVARFIGLVGGSEGGTLGGGGGQTAYCEGFRSLCEQSG
jgi:hypothetical protein